MLASLKQAFWNWGHVARTELWGWDAPRGMCDGWHGVTCSPQGHVTALDLKTLPPRPPVISPLSDGFDDTIVHGSRAPQLQGELRACLPACLVCIGQMGQALKASLVCS